MKHIKYLIVIFLLVVLFPQPVFAYDAQEIDLSIHTDEEDYTELLCDANYWTTQSFNKDTSIVIESTTAFKYLYIEWDRIPSKYTYTYNSITNEGGTNQFLHELIELEDITKTLTINTQDNLSIANIYAYTKGTLPKDIQSWDKPSTNADMLFFATHADDEILFLGGALATYADKQADIQVAYLCDFFLTEPVREHEKLDGLWESGIKHYPINGTFTDLYCESLDEALELFDYDNVLQYVNDVIQNCKPQVLVTQDINGEYGHGAHMLLVKAVLEAIDNTKDKDHQVSKTYLHLYDKNKITLDLNQPLDTFENRTALQVAKDAYKKHVTQQVWDNLYVTDDPNDINSKYYNASYFGLYQSLVGDDTGNDMLENITLHKDEVEIEVEAEVEEEVDIPLIIEDPFMNCDPTTYSQPNSNKNIYIFGITLMIIALVILIKRKFR